MLGEDPTASKFGNQKTNKGAAGGTKRGKVMQRQVAGGTQGSNHGGTITSGQRSYGYIPSGNAKGHMLLTQNYTTNPQIPTGTNSLIEESLLKQKKANIKKKQSIIGLDHFQNPQQSSNLGVVSSVGPPQNRGVPPGAPLIAFHEPHIEDQYERRNSRGSQLIGSPKQTHGDAADIQVLNSGRQSNRRQSNLPGIVAPSSRGQITKQQQPYKMNDQVISIIKQYTKQNSYQDLQQPVQTQVNQNPQQQQPFQTLPIQGGFSRDNPHRQLARNMTYEEEINPQHHIIHPQPVLMMHHEPLGNMILAGGGFGMNQAFSGGGGPLHSSQSRNIKLGGTAASRGPKTIANRTQGDDTTPASLQPMNKLKYQNYSNSPERTHANFANGQKLREIHSTVQLLQAYQPGALVIRPETLIMDQNQRSLSSFGGSDTDSLQRVFNGTMQSVKQSAQMELKSMKRSEYATKRQKGLKPPVLPQGITAANMNADSMKRSGKVSAGGPLSQNSTGGFFQSPDDRQRQQYNSKVIPISKSRNQLQQPNTVREEVVQISANISSTNTSQQKPMINSTIQDLQSQSKTPMKISKHPFDSRSSGIPTTQVWQTAGVSGSIGSSAGSQEIEIGSADGSASNTNSGFTKRNVLLRPQTIIKVRRRNEQNAVKLATLRQLSNEVQRDRNSLGSNEVVAVIDSLDEEEDDEVQEEVEQPQLRNMNNPSSGVQRVLQLKTGLTIKTSGGKHGVDMIPVISRNSPLAKDEGLRTVAEINMCESLTNHNQRNRLPPSLKTGTIDVTNSGGLISQNDEQQTSADGGVIHGSLETGKIAKKKIAFVTSKVSSDSQVNFNPKKSTRQIQDERVSNHRVGNKFVVNPTGGQRTNSTPNLLLLDHNNNNNQSTSANSSKIDKILAKIDKNRSDSIKNQLGNILKKTQSAGGNIVGGLSAVSQFDSQQQQSSSLTSQRGAADTLSHKFTTQPRQDQEDSPQTVSSMQQFLRRDEEIKQLEFQQRKILKIVTNANANTNFDSNKRGAAIVKKKQVKVVKGSIERKDAVPVIQTGAPNQPQVIKLKNIRDARSQEPVGGLIIEKQGIYLPAEVADREFSPLGHANNKQMEVSSQIKGKKKKLLMRIQSHEQPEQPPMMIVVSPHQDDMNSNHHKPMKKSILHSMQPHEHHQSMLSKNQQQHNLSQQNHQSISSGEGGSNSDKQSTEISTNQGFFFGSKTNVIPRPFGSGGATPFDQSSLLCLTSSSVVHNQKGGGGPQNNHMTIQDGVSPKENLLRPRGVHYQTTIQRTSIKENPLEHSLKSSVGQLKYSSRYGGGPEHQNFLIKEDANEEKESSSNSNSNQPSQQQPPVTQQATLTTPIALTNTGVNSSMMAEELHIEPIDSDDKLFRDVVNQATSRKKYSEVSELFERAGPSGKGQPVVTVFEQSEMSSQQKSSGGGGWGGSSMHRAVINQVEQQQRYSNKEVDDNEGRNQVLSFTGKHRRFNGSLLNQYEDDEDIASVQVVAQDESIKRSNKEEDDEAVEVSHGKPFGKSSELLQINKAMQDKKKHWLLDSDRFDIVLQTNAQNQQSHKSDLIIRTGEDDVRVVDDDSQCVQSDTVIFERDQSSVAGTPPKIAQKMNKRENNNTKDARRKHSDDLDDDTVNISETSSQMIIPTATKPKGQAPPNSMQRLKKHDSSSIIIGQSGMRHRGGDIFSFNKQQDSYDELFDAQQQAFIDRVFKPIEQSEPRTRAQNEQIMSELNTKMKMDKKEGQVPTNPHWVMQKQVKMLPPMDHYLRPTYYDVIYLQPQLDPTSRRSKVSSQGSGGALRGSNLGVALLRTSHTFKPVVCELGPRLETDFNFDKH